MKPETNPSHNRMMNQYSLDRVKQGIPQKLACRIGPIAAWITIALAIFHSRPLIGQTDAPQSKSQIQGQVSGAASASGLSIILEGLGILREVHADAAGDFEFKDLPPGEYHLKATGNGYDLGSAQRLTLDGEETAHVEIQTSALHQEGFVFQWSADSSSAGTEISSHINVPLEVSILGKQQTIDDGNYQQFLWNRFSIALSSEEIRWNQEMAFRLLETFYQLLDGWKPDTLIPSLWQVTSQELENDIVISEIDGEKMVLLSDRVFTYASPLMAKVEGKRGTFYSKRLHHACLRFLAADNYGRNHLERILENRFGVKVSGIDYAALSALTTQETAERFQPFHMEEMIQIINLFEEMPEGFHKIPNLKYMVRRQTGMDHPFYAQAPAVAWTSLDEGYIEFVDKAFTTTSIDYLHRLIIHEKAHFIYGRLLSDSLRQQWHELGGWYPNEADPNGWSTTSTTEFVSAYAHLKNPNEDFAESIAYFVINPDKLNSRAPAKYEFIRDRIMQGSVYISKIREDLTFEVLNLYPDYDYPGKIKRVHVEIKGEAHEDKELTLTVEIQTLEGVLDGASLGRLRITSTADTWKDMYLKPIDASGSEVSSSHLLQGTVTFSKYAKSGYWFTDQITIMDEVGNERHSGVDDFGWKMFLNNPLEDITAPHYVPETMSMALESLVVDGLAMRRLKIEWEVDEDKHMAAHANCYVSLLPPGENAYRLESYGYGIDDGGDGFDTLTDRARVDFLIPEFFRSGTYAVQMIRLIDQAGNEEYVYFSGQNGDQTPVSIDITTSTPDTSPPSLDLNRFSLEATPTNPQAPNGETIVDLSYWVRDDLSGLGVVAFQLRDPQGIEHHYYHYHDNFYGLDYQGDPSAWTAYEATVILPVGSAPGIWGVSELYLRDKANNVANYDFTETIRFDLDGNELLVPLTDGTDSGDTGGQAGPSDEIGGGEQTGNNSESDIGSPVYTWQEGPYDAWNGNTYDTYYTVTDHCVLYISRHTEGLTKEEDCILEEQFEDKETLNKLAHRVDQLYGFYLDNLGFHPPGGNPEHDNKANVFLGQPGCGAGCGAVGAKGLEASGFQRIFYNLKYDLNVNADVIIAYEFGRNFFTFGDRIQFPFDASDPDARNGGFAEGFASLMVLYGFNEIMTDPSQRHLNETLVNLSRSLDTHYAYRNDLTANPLNSWARWEKSGLLDPSRMGVAGNFWGTYGSGSTLVGIIEFIGREKVFPQFFTELMQRPKVFDIQDSLDNIAISFSKAAGFNYGQYFDKVLKFNLSAEARQELSELPTPPNELLPDKERLWFIEEKQIIPILGRTTRYLEDEAIYSLYWDDALIASSIEGNFEVRPEFLGADMERTFTLIAKNPDGTEIGRNAYLIKRRQDVPVLEYFENAYAYYTANKVTRVSLVGEHQVGFEKYGDSSVADHGLLWIDWPFMNHRNYHLKGEFTYDSIGELSHFGFGFDSPAGGHWEPKAYLELDDGFYLREQLHPTHYSYDEAWGRKYQWGRISAGGASYIESGTIRSLVFTDKTDQDCDGIPDLSADFSQDADGDEIEDFVDPDPTQFNGESFVIRLRGDAELHIPFGQPFIDPGFVAYDPTDGDITAQVTQSTQLDETGQGFSITYSVTNGAQQTQEITRHVQPSPAQALIIDSPPDNTYSRWYRPVSLSPGTYTLELVTGSQYYEGDRNDLPILDFFKGTEEPILQLGPWMEVSLPGGGFHLSRSLVLESHFQGNLRFALLNYRPVAFNRIDLKDEYGQSVLDTAFPGKHSCWEIDAFSYYEDVADTTPPEIELLGGAITYLELGQAFQEPGLIGLDAFSGIIEAFESHPPIDSSVVGESTIQYVMTDDHGNQAIAERTVIVYDPSTGFMRLVGPAQITLQPGSTYSDQGVELVGLNSSQGQLITNNPVNTSIPGRYEVEYTFIGHDQQVIFSLVRSILVEGHWADSTPGTGQSTGFSGAPANGQPRVAILDNAGSGYARLVQDVALEAGIYHFRIISDQYVAADDNSIPEFFRIKPADASTPTTTDWVQTSLQDNWIELTRQLTVSEAFDATLVVSVLNHLPRKYRLIELIDAQGLNRIQDPLFESNDHWYLDGGFVRFEQQGYDEIDEAPQDGGQTVDLETFGGLELLPDAPAIYPVDVAGSTGEEVSIPFKVRNFNGIGGIQLAINYDESILQLSTFSVNGLTFPKVSSYQADDGQGDQISLISLDNFEIPTDASKLQLLWSDKQAIGVTIPDGETLFSVRFKLVGPAGSVGYVGIGISSNEIPPYKLAPIQGGEVPETTRAAKVSITNNDLSLSGNIRHGADASKPLGGVTVTLDEGSNQKSTQSDADGAYAFSSVPQNTSLRLTADREKDNLGVDVADILVLRKHILNKTLLSSGIAMLASDPNRDGSIDVADIVAIRKVILRKSDHYSTDNQGNPDSVWRFFNQEILDKALNQVLESADGLEGISLETLVADVSGANFVGVKLGDANLDWNDQNSSNTQSMRTSVELGQFMRLGTPKPQPSGELIVELFAETTHELIGLQLGVVWDETVLHLKGVQGTLLPGFNQAQHLHVTPGSALLAWDDATLLGIEHHEKQPLLQWVFKVKSELGRGSAIDVVKPVLIGNQTERTASKGIGAYYHQEGTLVAESPGPIRSARYQNDEFEIEIQTQVGMSYAVEISHDLNALEWINVFQLKGTGLSESLKISTSGHPQTYLRVVALDGAHQ